MVWFRIDDSFWSHPKVLGLSTDAVALWVRAGSYSAQQLTDGLIAPHALRMLGDRDAAVELTNAGLWETVPAAAGWQFHDWADYQPTRAQILAEREGSARRQQLSRNPRLRDAIRERDGDFCRYCGKRVNWSDRKSATGGTYDHVDPSGPNSFENLVVACRGCNSAKGQRTPEQAGMPLLAPRSVSRSNLDQPIPTMPARRASAPVSAPDPFCPKHMPGGPGGRSCRACGDAKMAVEAHRAAAKARPTAAPFTVVPGALCEEGMHTLLPDGTCTRCEYRPGVS